MVTPINDVIRIPNIDTVIINVVSIFELFSELFCGSSLKVIIDVRIVGNSVDDIIGDIDGTNEGELVASIEISLLLGDIDGILVGS
mmetsp:Transcript_27392/g.33418  ORF Transcript_27392/g.33418 Transcript_27392/m.33418 type:complete len:86 (-) Transcript_27392:360-617(-)